MTSITMKGLDESLRDDIRTFVESEKQKISERVHNEVDVDVHIKDAHNKLVMSARANYPGNILHSKQEGWDVKAMMKDAFDDMHSQIEHRYKENIRGKASTNEFFPEAA